MTIIRQYRETADGLKTLTQRELDASHSIELNINGKRAIRPVSDPNIMGLIDTVGVDVIAYAIFKNGRVIYKVGGVYSVVPRRAAPSIWMHQGHKPKGAGQRFGIMQDVYAKASGRTGTIWQYDPEREAEIGVVTDKDYRVQFYRSDFPPDGYDKPGIWHSGDELESVLLLPDTKPSKPIEARYQEKGFHPLKIEILTLSIGRLRQMTDEQVLREGVLTRVDYIDLWDRINGAAAWNKNPVVARIGYQVRYGAHTAVGSAETQKQNQRRIE